VNTDVFFPPTQTGSTLIDVGTIVAFAIPAVVGLGAFALGWWFRGSRDRRRGLD
jgi:hypothetical protein